MQNERIKILLVEDSLADARLLVEAFKDENINADITVVRDGEEATEYLEQAQKDANTSCPDLILLDLNMPRKDGREFLCEIKNKPELRSIPVVVLSTSRAEDDISKSYALQASCFVSKPIDLADFGAVVRSFSSFWISSVIYPPKQCQ
ncbi:MAG: response regulator [Candidatus Obscuribacter sp.]|jgi:chemotaxis family two-component system response regulator Rcp1|nr:response regulator [Candidatus Obscuribacter sp.]MBK7839446.1 response regulator [Candidatus Obscuribacter sp.]MBK9769525.1 response regulator [Candidatus Obscuribacter sp.]